MIDISHLSKVYGGKPALSDVSFTVRPGQVTGFLGPNGAGKSTTMRIVMGLETATSGTATVLGKPLRAHDAPLRSVGALLDARSLHPARKAKTSLRALADSNGIPSSRVDEVLDMTGLGAVADKRSGGFSLGMGQRLGIAAALLGDPQVLLFDEPVNGLDPEGVTWVRRLCRDLASQGRTVLISSHLMSEMAQTADRVVVIGRGHILADATLDEFVSALGDEHVVVASESVTSLGNTLHAQGIDVRRIDERRVAVRGVDSARVGRIAFEQGLALEELTPVKPSLEEAYMRLTSSEVEYRSGGFRSGAPDPSAQGLLSPADPTQPAAATPAGSIHVNGPLSPSNNPELNPAASGRLRHPADSAAGVPGQDPAQAPASRKARRAMEQGQNQQQEGTR